MAIKVGSRAPIAVFLSDVHFNVPNLELSTAATIQAQNKALELQVPLVISGDLTDTKAIIRGEVANRLIEIFGSPSGVGKHVPTTIVLVGNHDLLNQKAQAHALNFLKPYVEVIDEPMDWPGLGHLIPYFSNGEALKAHLKTLHPGGRLIMHQGVVGADLGHYVKDESALPPEVFADFRVISGHYHKAQNIKCGRPRKGAVGLFSFVGNPYTMTFGEANDGPKGYQVLYDDGLLELVPTNLRKHVKIERNTENVTEPIPDLNPNDLLWLIVKGPASELDKFSKAFLSKAHGITNFKLDKIPDEVTSLDAQEEKLTDMEAFDKIVEQGTECAEEKARQKALARELLGGAA